MAFTGRRFLVTEAETVDEGLAALEAGNIAAAVLDLQLRDGHAGPLIDYLREAAPPIPWLVTSTEFRADAEARFGSFDSRFVPKPYDPWKIVESIERSLGTDLSS